MSEPVREDFLDFDTAWRIQREGITHTDQRCSAVQAKGGFLCDCGAVTAEWNRRVFQQRADADHTNALTARIAELEKQLTHAQAALDNPEITDDDLTNARRDARHHGIHEAARADYARVFAIGHLRGYRAAANRCWIEHPDGGDPR